MGSDYNTESEKENDDMLEENYMAVHVKMIYEKTIRIKCDRNMTAVVISDEVERRSSIPRDMTYLVNKGQMMSEKKTIKENYIEAEATIEVSLRLLGGVEKMNKFIHMEQKKGEKEKAGGRKRRKIDETKRRHGSLEKRHNGSI